MTYRRRRITDEPSSSGNTGQLMSLSLFIMLLAFFIVLNAISSYQNFKKEKAVRSVNIAFSTDVRDLDESPSMVDTPEKSVHEGHVFDRLDALFEAEISTYKATIDIGEGLMSVTMPLEEFSRAMMAVGQQDLLRAPSRSPMSGKFFLPTLASLLRTNIEGQITRMEILMHVPENPAHVQNKNPQELIPVMTRLSGFSDRMEDMGFPQQLLNIGVKKGKKGFVTLVFRRHQPFSFKKEVEEESSDG